jgi:hypothetical protein
MNDQIQDNLTAKQTSDNGLSQYAVFLPAISGFYAAFVGKQRNEHYVDPARFPQGLTDMEQLNWLNSQKALFPYRWSLYSGGHANLDLSKQDWSEDMVRNREPGTFILGDSGGFQIAKGLWEGDWRDPTSASVQNKLAALQAAGPETVPILDKSGNQVFTKKGKPKVKVIDHAKNYQQQIDAAQKKREQVLAWLDGIADYGMILDIPTWVVKDDKASKACGITTHQEAVDATKYNNEYFMQHRRGVKNGGARFLNVLQGATHEEADNWYEIMKDYCDPVKYPDTHFNGWAMGGQNMCDVHLILKRLVALRYDNLLQEGVHDWMHFLGTSKLEWAVLLTVIQRAVRKYVNPAFTISFDCASPFLATANGQVYYENVFPHDDKWSYRMAPSADDKRYATDTRPWAQGVVADGIYDNWQDSPVSDMLTMQDICIYKPGVPKPGVIITEDNFRDPELYDVLPDANKNGKWGKTSWDSFSYALLMSHNVWMHLTAVQEANRRFDAGEHPAMMQRNGGDYEYFEDIVESIFAAPDRVSAEGIIEYYSNYWMQIVGTRGNKGKKTMNSHTQFNKFIDFDETKVEFFTDDSVQLSNACLDQLEQDQRDE